MSKRSKTISLTFPKDARYKIQIRVVKFQLADRDNTLFSAFSKSAVYQTLKRRP
jgi:hypothetical protein